MTVAAAAASLALAGVAHGLAAVDHRQSVAAAAFFVVAAVGQLGLALAYVRGPSDRLRLSIVAATTLLLGVWVASRTVGIAIGHSHGPESVGMLDAIAVAGEVVTLLAIAAARWRGRWRQLSVATALSVVVAGTAVYSAAAPAEQEHPPSSTHAHP